MGFMKRLHRGEHGAVMIMVAVSMVMIFAFAVMAIDLSLVMLTKTQLQNAADAAALAGARTYGATGGTTADKQTAATASAIQLAGLNKAYKDLQDPVVITGGDVAFSGDTITVTTHRSHDSDDPLQLYFLRVVNSLSDNKGDVTARASAMVSGSSTAKCLRPWIFPDRWTENSVPKNDLYDPGVDVYDGTGYRVPNDVGASIKLFFDNGKTPSIRTGWYQAVDFGNGADCYREAIAGCVCDANCCNSIEFKPGDTLIGTAKPGAMVGPTKQGLGDLIASDPSAYYDVATQSIKGSDPSYTQSPRLVPVAVYDPSVGFLTNKQLIIQKIVVIFVEGYDKDGNVTGRFMQKYEPEGDPNGQPGFLMTTHLVR